MLLCVTVASFLSLYSIPMYELTYTIYSWWTFALFPLWIYYGKKCCYEHPRRWLLVGNRHKAHLSQVNIKSQLTVFSGRTSSHQNQQWVRTQVSEVTGQAPWEADATTECGMQDVYYGVPLGSQVAPQAALGVKNPPANVGDLRDVSSICGSGRSSRGGNGNPLQYSCLENPMDSEA